MEYAFISGASDRIGKSIALKLSESGYNIILHYNSGKEKAIKTREIIKKDYNVDCILCQIDFSDSENVKNTIPEVFSNYNIKILVNNASVFYTSNFDSDGDIALYNNFNINFVSAYLLTKLFKKYCKEGVIINIVDTKITRSSTRHLDYILTKKLLAEFTKISATELAPHIRVNAIAPGLILPPADKDHTYLEERAKNIPLKITGNSMDVQNAVTYLINNKFMTGQILYLDGGENL